MSGRIYVVILFFWALLTIITPMLVRLSASANLHTRFDGEKRVGVKLLLPRRALIEAAAAAISPAPAPVAVENSSSGGGDGFSGEFWSRVDRNRADKAVFL